MKETNMMYGKSENALQLNASDNQAVTVTLRLKVGT